MSLGRPGAVFPRLCRYAAPRSFKPRTQTRRYQKSQARRVEIAKSNTILSKFESWAGLATMIGTAYCLYLMVTTDSPALIQSDFLKQQRTQAERRRSVEKGPQPVQDEQKIPPDASEDARFEQELQSALEWKLRQHELFAQDRQDEMDPTLFIPLGIARELPVTYYKGSDPEWQQFIRVSRDRNWIRDIKKEIIDRAVDVVRNTPYVTQNLGTDIKPVRIWLDLHFPDKPPPLFERTGLEFNPKLPDGWAISTQYVKANDVWRLEKMFHPSKTAKAFCSGVSDPLMRYWTESVTTPKSSGPGGGPKFDGGDKRLGALRKASDLGEGEKKAVGSQHESNPSLLPLTYFWSTYRNVKQKVFGSYIRSVIHPERGAICITGFVEVVSPKATMVLDITSFYNPKPRKVESMSISIRSLQPQKQSPKG